MSGRDVSRETSRSLLNDAARWRITGLLFRRPDPARRLEITGLAGESGDPDLIRAAARASSTSEGLYLAWVGPGGPLSPREVSYRPIEDPGRILSEIGSFHRAFGYRPGREDPADHVAVAADFVAYLDLKEAYAAEFRDTKDAVTTQDARRAFVERHVRPMARGMARRLRGVERGVDTAHFAHAVDLLMRLSGANLETDVDDAADAPFLPPGLDDESFECGACPVIHTDERRVP